MFLRRLASGAGAVEETISRASRYAADGADGIFVPGLTDPASIETLVREITLPLNVLSQPGLPPARELQRLGVRRLRTGAWLARAVFEWLLKQRRRSYPTAIPMSWPLRAAPSSTTTRSSSSRQGSEAIYSPTYAVAKISRSHTPRIVYTRSGCLDASTSILQSGT